MPRHVPDTRPKMNKNITGFTLIELMIVLVVVGIGMSVAVPNFQGMIVRNRIIAQTNDVILAVNLARGEAARTGGLVSIATVSTTSDYTAGWCIVLGTPATCAAGNVVRRFDALQGETTIVDVDAATGIQFNSLGGLSAAGPQTHNIDLCYPNYQGRRIKVTLIGRVKSYTDVPTGDTASSC